MVGHRSPRHFDANESKVFANKCDGFFRNHSMPSPELREP